MDIPDASQLIGKCGPVSLSKSVSQSHLVEGLIQAVVAEIKKLHNWQAMRNAKAEVLKLAGCVLCGATSKVDWKEAAVEVYKRLWPDASPAELAEVRSVVVFLSDNRMVKRVLRKRVWYKLFGQKKVTDK